MSLTGTQRERLEQCVEIASATDWRSVADAFRVPALTNVAVAFGLMLSRAYGESIGAVDLSRFLEAQAHSMTSALLQMLLSCNNGLTVEDSLLVLRLTQDDVVDVEWLRTTYPPILAINVLLRTFALRALDSAQSPECAQNTAAPPARGSSFEVASDGDYTKDVRQIAIRDGSSDTDEVSSHFDIKMSSTAQSRDSPSPKLPRPIGQAREVRYRVIRYQCCVRRLLSVATAEPVHWPSVCPVAFRQASSFLLCRLVELRFAPASVLKGRKYLALRSLLARNLQDFVKDLCDCGAKLSDEAKQLALACIVNRRIPTELMPPSMIVFLEYTLALALLHEL